MKRQTIIILGFSITTVATVAYAARSLGGENAPAVDSGDADDGAPAKVINGEAPSNPVVVKTMAAEVRNLAETVTATGVTSPIREVTFSAEIPGKVEYIGADLGDKVRKGQVLARVDFDTLTAEKNRAEAAYDLAKSTHDRFAKLGEDIVSRQKVDETYTNMVTSRAGLKIAENSVSKSVIRSSIKGIVTAKLMEKGEFATPGKPLLHVVDYSTVVVEAQLAETEIAAIRRGSEATVRIDALDEELRGEVKTILPLADTASKTFTVRVELDNRDLRILVGMSATITLTSRVHENVVVVPQDVVIEGTEGRSVFVTAGDTAERRTVTLGPTEGDRVVIADGVRPGEEIVILGHRNLEHGQSIIVAN